MSQLTVAFCLIPTILLGQVSPRSEADSRVRTLALRAAEAKANQMPEVTFVPPEQIPTFSASFLDSASKFSVIIGHLSATQALVDDRHITTWYALNIDDVLTEHLSSFAAFDLNSIPPSQRPTRLLPIEAKQVLLVQPGGKTTIQGVSIIEREAGDTALHLNRPHLFILEISADHKLARLPFGLAGVFEIQSDGDSLSPTTSASRSISDDVKLTYSCSLSVIRQKLSNH
jgi:hypothetical protein